MEPGRAGFNPLQQDKFCQQLSFIVFVTSNCGRNHAGTSQEFSITVCVALFSPPLHPPMTGGILGQNYTMLCNAQAVNTTPPLPHQASACSIKAIVCLSSSPSLPTRTNPGIY